MLRRIWNALRRMISTTAQVVKKAACAVVINIEAIIVVSILLPITVFISNIVIKLTLLIIVSILTSIIFRTYCLNCMHDVTITEFFHWKKENYHQLTMTPIGITIGFLTNLINGIDFFKEMQNNEEIF